PPALRNGVTMERDAIIGIDDPVIVTGAAGFIGSTLVETLLARGFRHVRCLVRPGSSLSRLEAAMRAAGPRLEIIRGNLLSAANCAAAVADQAVIFHLAAGRGEKSFPDSFLNSVVTTRNLLEAAREQSALR